MTETLTLDDLATLAEPPRGATAKANYPKIFGKVIAPWPIPKAA